MASFNKSSFIPKSIAISQNCINDPVVLQLKAINNNMRKIDAYVIIGLKGKRKTQEEGERRKNKLDRLEKESSLEKQRKANPINFIKGSIPKSGFLDAIKNFILYTAIGKMVPFVLKNLPAILNVTKTLIPVYNFLENFFSNVLKNVVNAIDFGYNIHDNLKKTLRNVLGSKFENTFNELEKTLNTFLNVAIIAGLAIGGSGVGNLLKSKNVPQQSKTIPPSTGTTSTPRKFKIPSLPGGKFLGKFSRIFSRVPIVGGLIDLAVSIMFGEKIGRAAARAIGSTMGVAIGTLIPIPFAGSLIGGILGDIVGGSLYDTLGSFGKPKKMATGGQVGRKSKIVSRTIKAKKVQKPPKQITQRSIPGKNIGGKEEIEKIFTNSEDPNVMSPMRLISKNSSLMRQGGILGKFLSSGIDLMVLGQKIERPTLMGLEKYLAYVIDSSIAEKDNLNSKSIASTMFAMAEGGVVPISRAINQTRETPGTTVAKDIIKSFTFMVNNRSVEIIKNIKNEISLFKPIDSLIGPTQIIDNMSGFGTPEEQALLKAIRFAEGTEKSYGVIFGGAIIPELAEGKMTVQEVIQMGNTGRLPTKFGGRSAGYGSGSSATGAYQFMPFTLQSLVNEGVLNSNDLFTTQLQDMAALALAKRRGVTLEDLRKEGLSANIVSKLAPEWASFPTTRGGSFYGQPFKELGSLQNIYKQSLEQAKSYPTNLPYGVSSNIGMTYRTNTMANQYYGAPRSGRIHAGVDLDLGPNDSQITFLGGVIQYIGHQRDEQGREYGYGKFVDILTPTGMIERLAELGTLEPNIAVGKRVSPGQIISRGQSFSGVTHLEYRKPGTSGITGTINPLEYLRKLRVIEGGNTFNFRGLKQDKSSTIGKPRQISSNQSTSKSLMYISNQKIYSDNDQYTKILIQPILT